MFILFTALTLAAARADDACASRLAPERARRFWSLPTRARARLVRLAAEDPRRALRALARRSPTLDRLDHFSSPALYRTVVTNAVDARILTAGLREVARLPLEFTPSLAARGPVPAHLRLLAELVERRHRVAAVMAVTAAHARDPAAPLVTAAAYARSLAHDFGAILRELRASDRYGDVFADVDSAPVERAEPAATFRPRPVADAGRPFRPRFLSAVDPALDLAPTLDGLGRELDRRLAELPVGVTHPYAVETAAVRFGPRLYLGDLGRYYGSVHRLAFLRTRPARLTTEVLLDLPNHRKKMVALLLDRQHRTLDPIFRLDRPRERWPNTCGTYVSLTFWRAGVPILSPTYLTPGTPALVTAARGALGLGPVDSVRVTLPRRPSDALADAAHLLRHELAPSLAELYVSVHLLSGLFNALF